MRSVNRMETMNMNSRTSIPQQSQAEMTGGTSNNLAQLGPESSADLRQRTSIQVNNSPSEGQWQLNLGQAQGQYQGQYQSQSQGQQNQGQTQVHRSQPPVAHWSQSPTPVPMTQNSQPTGMNEYDIIGNPSQININSKQSLLREMTRGISPASADPYQIPQQQKSQQQQPSEQPQALRRPTSRKVINLAEVSMPNSSQASKFSSPSALVLSAIPPSYSPKDQNSPSKVELSPLAKHMNQLPAAVNTQPPQPSSVYDNPSVLSEHSNFNSGSSNSSGIGEEKRFGLGKKKTKMNGFEAKNGFHSQVPNNLEPLDPVIEEKG